MMERIPCCNRPNDGHHHPIRKTRASTSISVPALLLLVGLLLVLGQQNIVLGQTAVQEETATSMMMEQELGLDLESMSDAELEEICTTRGFELYRELDEDTGNMYEFTHEDYIDAARQCLAVEREMNDIIAEHPELLDQLHAEAEAMKQENERLEKELADAQQKHTGAAEASRPAFGVPHHDTEKKATNEHNETVEASKLETAHHEEKTVDEVIMDDSTEKVTENVNVTSTSTEDSQGSSSKEDKVEASLEETPGGDGPQSLQGFGREMVSQMKSDLQKVQHGWNKVVDTLVPKPVRGPLKAMFLQFYKVGKQTGVGVFHMLSRYLKALVQNAQNRKKEENKEQSEKETQKEEQGL